MHHRNYNPKTGVFTSADPAKEDLNLYRYVKNNPVNRTDPSGLDMFMFDAGSEAGEIHSARMGRSREYNAAVDSMQVALEGINTQVKMSADALQDVQRTGKSMDGRIDGANENIERLMQLYVERRNRVIELAAGGYGYGVTVEDLERYLSSHLPPGPLAEAMGDSYKIPAELQRSLNSRVSGETKDWDAIVTTAERVDTGVFYLSLALGGTAIVVNGLRVATTEGGKILVRKAATEIAKGGVKVAGGAAIGIGVSYGINSAADAAGATEIQKAWISLGIDLAAAAILKRRNKVPASVTSNGFPKMPESRRGSIGIPDDASPPANGMRKAKVPRQATSEPTAVPELPDKTTAPTKDSDALNQPSTTNAADDIVAPNSVKNWRGEPVRIPEGHIMSPRDPAMSAAPKFEYGPFTTAERNAMLTGESGGTRLSPHHRHQIPTTHGGVIDELPGPGHPSGNIHTAGPSRHPSPSIFNPMEGGKALRKSEINSHWRAKGQRMIEVEPGVWIDPGF